MNPEERAQMVADLYEVITDNLDAQRNQRRRGYRIGRSSLWYASEVMSRKRSRYQSTVVFKRMLSRTTERFWWVLVAISSSLSTLSRERE